MSTQPLSSPPADDSTLQVQRNSFPIEDTMLPVFSPPADRTLDGLRRFVGSCLLHPPSAEVAPATLARDLESAEVVRVANEKAYMIELVVLRLPGSRIYAVYDNPPSDLLTRIPSLSLVDLGKSRAILTPKNGRPLVISALTVDDVSHLIVLSQVATAPAPSAGVEGDEIEVVFDED